MPGLDPLKQQIWFTYSDKEKPRQVIGVVRDVKEGPLDMPARPAIYSPMEGQRVMCLQPDDSDQHQA